MSAVDRLTNFFKKIWFPLFIVVVIVIYFAVDQTAALVLLVIMIIVLIIQMIYAYLQTRSFNSYLKQFLRIDDITIAKELGDPIPDVKNALSDMMKTGNYNGLIVLISGTYYYYNPKMVKVLNKILIEHNFPTAEIFRVLKKYDITTKEELRAIRNGLKRFED